MTNLKVMVMVVATACGSFLDPMAQLQILGKRLDQALGVKPPLAVSEAVAAERAAPKRFPQHELIWGD